MAKPLTFYRNLSKILIIILFSAVIIFISILYGAIINYQGVLDFFPQWSKVYKIAKFFPEIYVRETPFGLIPSNSAQGIKYKDLTFIKEFRGKISDLNIPEELQYNSNLDPLLISTSIKTKLKSEFDLKLPLLALRMPYENDLTRWLAFLTLRINGSFSAYSVRFMHNDYWSRLFSNTGNCSDHATRLANVLDLYDIPTYWFTINTKSIPGHIIVSLTDRKSQTSFILDPTNNLIITFKETKEIWLKKWILLAPEDREKEFIRTVKIIKFPSYFRIVNPGITSLDGININEVTLNKSLSKIEDSYKKFLTSEFDEQIKFWKNIHAPHYPDYANKLKPIDLLNGKFIKWKNSLKDKQTINFIKNIHTEKQNFTLFKNDSL